MLIRRVSFSLIVALILSCILFCSQPTKPSQSWNQRNNQEYLFAQEFLYAFFIFPDSLPKDTFGFSTPQALYQSVNERWTRYFPPDSAKLFLNSLTTNTAGMGILIDSIAKGYRIQSVFPNSPAQSAGMMKGDTVDSINGTSIAGISYDDFGTIAGGNIGDVKRLHILRDTGAVAIVVTLGIFLAPSVYSDSLDSTAAYIYLSIFLSETDLPGGTTEELDSALAATAWAPYTVLDLRGNPGGDLDQCVGVCSRFVPGNTPIIRIHEMMLDTTVWATYVLDTVLVSAQQGNALQRKFVVLVDSNTASAAEILTSCLMSNRPDIKTMGERTFGKGRGQVLNITPDSALVKVTYALLSPLVGQNYDLVGIVPDIAVPPDSDAIAVAEALINQSVGAGAAKRLAASRAAIPFGRIEFLRKEHGRAGSMPMAYKKIRFAK